MNSRRDFLAGIARSFLLFLFGFGAFLGIRERKISFEARGDCRVNPACLGCGELVGCNKDQAVRYKIEVGYEG